MCWKLDEAKKRATVLRRRALAPPAIVTFASRAQTLFFTADSTLCTGLHVISPIDDAKLHRVSPLITLANA
jgi:hypothetical protein